MTSLEMLLAQVKDRPEPLVRDLLAEIARDHLYEVVQAAAKGVQVPQSNRYAFELRK